MFKQSEPMRNRCQGTLFKLEESEAEYLLALLAERNPDLSDEIEAQTGQEDFNALRLVTFHPSYSYEDFIEGFRPTTGGGDRLALRLDDGLFKRVCREAEANRDRNFLIVIDEINRANLAKVFGEIITLLERDKRDLPVLLPQSKEPFVVPPNVYILGTMNTSDRSIRLMDAALRRRFGFIEIMPEVGLLRGAQIDDLALDDYLMLLNERIARNLGREKQIGHAYFMDGDQPLSEPSEFARCFRQEVLPMLQEYCYDDYGALASYVGSELVDATAQRLRSDVVRDDERLIAALAAFTQGAAEEATD
jgi:5-methylcytosine-specific restriction protein B